MPALPGHLSPAQARLPQHQVADDAPMTLTVLLQPVHEPLLAQQEQRQRRGGRPLLPRAALLSLVCPPAERSRALLAHFASHGLTALAPRDGLVLRLTGSRRQVEAALGLRLLTSDGPREALFYPDREPSLPPPLDAYVAAVYGLDNLGRAERLVIPSPANGGIGFLPDDIARLYHFPPELSGRGETIALPEFGSGYAPDDVAAFWSQTGRPRSLPRVVSVAGSANDQGQGGPADVEATLDVEWAGAMAPGAELVVYEAPVGSTFASFAEALTLALHAVLTDEVHHPSVVSLSYGDGECSFPARLVQGWDALCRLLGLGGVSVFAAAGDQGSYGLHQPIGPLEPHVDVPAALPSLTAVGGTTVLLGPDGSRCQERAWSDTNGNGATGGGISQLFPVPPYQAGVPLPKPLVGHPGRGVPDVALDADVDSGYAILFQGEFVPIGGTSAAAPGWAAIAALANEARRARGLGPLGFLNPRLYALHGQCFLDITEGDNAYLGVPGYNAGPGWDAVTGWGVPDVACLVAALGA
jgi:kumamolisin